MTHTTTFTACCLLVVASVLTAAPLKSNEVTTDGMTLTCRGETFTITPLKVIPDSAKVLLKVGTPSWRGPVRTPNTSWRYRAMTPGSLKASLDGKPLKEGTDYNVDYNWGALGAPKNSPAADKKIDITYTHTLSRLDLLVEKDGKLSLIQGKADSRTPKLPAVPDGATPLLSVYLPHNTTTLSKANINIIDPTVKPLAPITGKGYIAPKLAKLKAGEPFTIAFLGDSITAQTDPVGGGFVERFRDWEKKQYPDLIYVRMQKGKKGKPVAPKKGQLAIVMAGVGGDTTVKGLARLDDHVLIHKPDIVFVMFGVNDENKHGDKNDVSPDQYEKNLTEIVKRVRAAGGEPVLMTTSMKNLGWVATYGNLDEYAKRARAVAKANKVCLIDHYQNWENLPKRGLNYMIPLGSCLNHPNDIGHEMFFQSIKALFDQKK